MAGAATQRRADRLIQTRPADRLPCGPGRHHHHHHHHPERAPTVKHSRRWMTAAAAGSQLVIAAGTAEADTEARTISGIVVPYGKVGATSSGRLKFSRGSLQISDPKRVKLLREHDQSGHVIGHGVSFEERDEGLFGTFAVPDTEAGTQALAEASLGLRDAFSVGVALDDKTLTRLRRSQGAAVEASGQLREVSTVSVPAFDDARMAASADLIVSSWTDASSGTTTTTTTGGNMNETQRRRLAELLFLASTSTLNADPQAELDQLQELAAANGVTVTAADHQPAPVATAAVVPAVAGAAEVTAEPPVYTFSGDGPGLMADLYAGAMRRDAEAAERVERFNAQLRDGNPGSVVAFATAAATRDNIDGAGTDLPDAWGGQLNYRPDLMRQLVDVRRPFISRIPRTPISNAQPFAIPTVGEFTGVGDHTEGTPHRAAGTLTLGAGDAVQPKATSGAWEVSRELLDAGNPVLDRIAVRAMLRDYQRQTEGKAVQLFVALAADAGAHRYGVDGVMGLRGALIDFVNDDDEPADLVGLSKALARTMLTELDGDDRPQLPFVGPVNAAGTTRAGYLGFAIDGVEVFRAARLDAAMAAATGPAATNTVGDQGIVARAEGLLWAESNVLQFRFDEVLGPGVVKLALWAYNGAAIIDTADVAILNSGADPTP